jgi:D-alanine-D-alanine ligase
MKIALAYDLQEDYIKQGFSKEQAAEFDKLETIDAIAGAIRSLGNYQVEKIGGLKQIVAALAQNHSWDLVFNITEGMFGLCRESAVPCILEAYQIPCTFSDANVLAICLHKGITKKIVRHLGIPTADFAVVNSAHELNNITLPFPLFVKPVGEGTGKGISSKSIINNSAELFAIGSELLKKYSQPILVETFLPGREFTVGIVGTGKNAKIIGVLEVQFKDQSCNNIYSYQTKANYQEKVTYSLFKEEPLANEISAISLQAWQGLNCRDAGRIDIRLDVKGKPMFMEVNPLAGLHPKDGDLVILCRLAGISYQGLIKMILDSAMQRVI